MSEAPAASKHMPFVLDDGGRAAAGYKPRAGDCVTRAIAIAAELPYQEVYAAMAEGTQSERVTKHKGASGRRTARSGINTGRKWFKDYMAALGWRWVPTMQIGQGCRVHLVAGELPPGRLIVSVSKHYTAVIDGVVRDTYDPQRTAMEMGAYDPVTQRNVVVRQSERCVYGYWVKAK